MMTITIIFSTCIKQCECFRLWSDYGYPTNQDYDYDDFLQYDEDYGENVGRHLELTSSILQLIYNLIGKTGHSAKSLELARQMNVSIFPSLSPLLPPVNKK